MSTLTLQGEVSALMNSKPSTTWTGPPGEVRPHSGFQAQIRGASLGDLIQMECLAGSRRIVRVTSGNSVGFLYFRQGGLVHASARSMVGEPAALDMLSWDEGTFDPIERDWPTRETISCTWQSLLIRAAQIRDERSAGMVDVHEDGRVEQANDVASASAALSGARTIPTMENIELDATPLEVAGHVLRLEDFSVALILRANGAVAVNHGSTQDFADIVAYACRLTQLIGADLGVENLVAMECHFKSGFCFIVREPGGDLIALRPRPSSDAGAIRDLLGL